MGGIFHDRGLVVKYLVHHWDLRNGQKTSLFPFPWKTEFHEFPMQKHMALVTLPLYCTLSTAKVAFCHLDMYLPTLPTSCRASWTKGQYWTLLADHFKFSQSMSSAFVVVRVSIQIYQLPTGTTWQYLPQDTLCSGIFRWYDFGFLWESAWHLCMHKLEVWVHEWPWSNLWPREWELMDQHLFIVWHHSEISQGPPEISYETENQSPKMMAYL